VVLDNDASLYLVLVTPGELAVAPARPGDVPTVSTNLVATTTPTGIALTWNAYAGATSYSVYRGTSAGGEGTTPIATGITSPNYTDGSLTYNTSYFYKVTAVDVGGETSKSNEASAFIAAPPTVMNVQVNDGDAQRSEVRSITVTFSGPVTFSGNPGDAFELLHIQNGLAVSLLVTVSTDGAGRTVAVLKFFGNETDQISAVNGYDPSLNDGRYRLTILGQKVSGSNGLDLDGAGTGSPGSNYVSPADSYGGNGLHLYRLFGDGNGDGVVDSTDVGRLRSTYNQNSSEPFYLSYLDANNDGVVDSLDVGQFRPRFNANVF